MSRKTKTEEYYRFFTVTDPRTHEKGHTEYKVTARVSSTKTQRYCIIIFTFHLLITERNNTVGTV